jgi:hypothetical protein
VLDRRNRGFPKRSRVRRPLRWLETTPTPKRRSLQNRAPPIQKELLLPRLDFKLQRSMDYDKQVNEKGVKSVEPNTKKAGAAGGRMRNYGSANSERQNASDGGRNRKHLKTSDGGTGSVTSIGQCLRLRREEVATRKVRQCRRT